VSWSEVRTSALVGTTRRPPAEPVVVAGVAVGGDLGPEARLLAAASVGGALRRAGRRPRRGVAVPAPAPGDSRPVAPAEAVQLLDLLLSGAVTTAADADLLVGRWIDRCAEAGTRAPHRLVVPLLDRATSRADLRPGAVVVVGERGRWLAAQRDDWSWAKERPDPAAATVPIRVDDWTLLPAAERLTALEAERHRDPGAARVLIAATWSTDPAVVRAAHLAVLAHGLEPADEDLLEAALDDRARSVRDVAQRLLDGLPDSARAARMAERLRPLLAVEGRRRKRSITVALPGDPDPAAVRDGLERPRAGSSARGFWLEQLAAGAPLDVWTDVSGADVSGTVPLITDDDARRGIVRAVLARRDDGWGRALFAVLRQPPILVAVEPGGREALVAAHLGAVTNPWALASLLDRVPAPWSGAFSAAVLRHLRAQKAPQHLVEASRNALAAGLHPEATAALQDWLDRAGDQPALVRALRSLLQVQSLRRSITEAFA
jgi:hypothetical protein